MHQTPVSVIKFNLLPAASTSASSSVVCELLAHVYCNTISKLVVVVPVADRCLAGHVTIGRLMFELMALPVTQTTAAAAAATDTMGHLQLHVCSPIMTLQVHVVCTWQ